MSEQAQTRKKLVADVFSRAAPLYAQLTFAYEYGQRLVELAHINSEMKVLDVGAGQGAVLFPAAERVGPGGRVIGIDMAETMIEQTSAEIQRRGLRNAEIRRMDAENLDFPDATFDYVLGGFSLMFFPELKRALAEFQRVLKPSGRIAMTTWGHGDNRWDWYYELLTSYQIVKVKVATQSLDNSNDLAASFEQAGFADIEVVGEETDIVYPDEEAWWKVRWSAGSRATLEGIAPNVLEKFKVDASGKMQPLKEADGLHEHSEVLYALATKPAA